MFLSPLKRKNLTTYSKKAQRIRHSTHPSPASDDQQIGRRRVTLTSPIHSNPPASLGSISLSSSAHSDDEDIEAQKADTELSQSTIQRRFDLPAEPSLNHELTLAVSPERIASPVSSSEHDSISDDDLIPAVRGGQKHTSRNFRPQPLSKLRKSLNTRPKKLQLATKRPTSILSSGTLREIERGADGFDEMHLILLAVSKPRSIKRMPKSATTALDLLRGPHPPVDFDDPDWSKVPYQDSLVQEQETVLDTAEATKDESLVVSEDTQPRTQGFRSPLVSPTRPSKKEVLLYAQLSSVSAPVIRRPSYDEKSEDSYANGFMDGADEEVSEHRTSDAEQEELRASTVR
ncbi:hypothetical protein KCU71_g14966, partial [Aureobasidium melanogenum]